MNREIVPKVKYIIDKAMKEAKDNEETHLKPEHVFMALLLDEKLKTKTNLSSSSKEYQYSLLNLI
jgi:ATP-dependent Clp protease ATP-binding subunit ClpA